MMLPCHPALAAIPLPAWAFALVIAFCHTAPLGAVLLAFWLGERGGQQPITKLGENGSK
jgi:hypothetical protein